jgi:hypothetical protein
MRNLSDTLNSFAESLRSQSTNAYSRRRIEGCNHGFNSIILFEKSLIFKAMIGLNKKEDSLTFEKKLKLFSRYHPETIETAQI